MSSLRRHIPKVCPICGKSFLAYRKAAKTCSVQCGVVLRGQKNAAMYAAKRAGTAVCAQCGAPLADQSTTNIRFCSKKCRDAFHGHVNATIHCVKSAPQSAATEIMSNVMDCPWSAGAIHGTAANADFCMGF